MKKAILFLLCSLILVSIASANQFSLGTGSVDDPEANNFIVSDVSGIYGFQSFLMPEEGQITAFNISFYAKNNGFPPNGTFKLYLETEINGTIVAETNDISVADVQFPTDFSYVVYNSFNLTVPYNATEGQTYWFVIKGTNITGRLDLFENRFTYNNGISYAIYSAYHNEDIVCTTFGIININGSDVDCVYPIDDGYDFVMNVEYTSTCTPDWVCTGYQTCVSPMVNASCNAVVDNNACGEDYDEDFSEFTPQTCNYAYVPVHRTSDIAGVVIDFGVEFGLQLIAFAGLIAIVGLGIYAIKVIKR